jgi:hemerythrin-like domain-containing protein
MLRDTSLIPLSHQHHNGLALCVLTRRSLAADSSQDNVARLARRVVDRFEIELVNHFQIEEQVLFPACGPMPIIADLLREHRAVEALVEQLRSAQTAALLKEFCELLSSHIRREERELFEDVQKALPREVLDRMGREIDQRAVRVCLDVGESAAADDTVCHTPETEPRP